MSKVQADFQFNGEPLTVSVVKTAAQTKIVELLSSITGEIRTSPLDGCSSDALILVSANENFATCDVAISADDIITEIDAIAEAGELPQLGRNTPSQQGTLFHLKCM